MHRFLYAILLLLTLIYGSAAASNTGGILVVGDSLSAAYGMDMEQGWVSLLQRKLNDGGYSMPVMNISISGETTSGALTRLPTALRQHRPQIVVIELGGNDGLRGISLSEMQNNIEEMIAMSQEQGAKILLLGVRLPPNYGLAFTERFQKVYQDVANNTEVKLVPYFMQGVAENMELMQADGIHPKQEAQNILLDNVWPSIEQILKDQVSG